MSRRTGFVLAEKITGCSPNNVFIHANISYTGSDAVTVKHTAMSYNISTLQKGLFRNSLFIYLFIAAHDLKLAVLIRDRTLSHRALIRVCASTRLLMREHAR